MSLDYMGYKDLIVGNFEMLQTKFYTQTELENMTPFEWEVALGLIKQRQERKNKMNQGS